MKQFLLFSFFAMSFFILSAQDYEWAEKAEGEGSVTTRSLAADASDNIFITGDFSGTVDFNPGAGVANLTATSATDMFIAKYSNSGAYIWAKAINGDVTCYANSIAVDASGNTYVTGSFQGNYDFNPGAGTAFLSSDGSVAFIAKYNTQGKYVWAKKIGSPGTAFSNAITIDASSNIYITGNFWGTVNFAGAELTSQNTNDIFLAKYNKQGNLMWAESFPSEDYGMYARFGTSLKTDASGNVYLTGHFIGSTDFDAGSGFAVLNSSVFGDIFIAKYSKQGAYIWAKDIQNIEANGSQSRSLQVDASGNVYIAGSLSGKTDFNPAQGKAYLTWTTNSNTGFIAKYNNKGKYIWAKALQDPQLSNPSAEGYAISLDQYANVYFTGYIWGTLDFDPGAGTAILSANTNAYNSFIGKYNSDGNYVWAGVINGEHNINFALACNHSGSIVASGPFSSQNDFDMGAGTQYLTTDVNHGAIFIAKYSDGNATGKQSFAKIKAGNQFNTGHTFTVTPNPAKDIINITLKNETKNLVISIFDSQGRQIKVFNKTTSSNTQLNIADLPCGIYLLQLNDGENVVTKKIIKE